MLITARSWALALSTVRAKAQLQTKTFLSLIIQTWYYSLKN